MTKLPLSAALVAAMFCALAGTAGAEEKQIDLAAIITQTDAASILGEPVQDAQPRNGAGSDGYYARCNYYSQSRAKSLVLRVHQSAAGKIEMKKQFEMLGAGAGKIKTVSGLGERAAYSSGSTENGAPSHVLMLYVGKGNSIVTVGLRGLADDTSALARAKGIARKILAQL